MNREYLDNSDQNRARQIHLREIESLVGDAYLSFNRTHSLRMALNCPLETIVRVAGRIELPPRDLGKLAFLHINDGENRLQVMFQKNNFVGQGLLPNDTVEGWELFKQLDFGDFIGIEGEMIKTKTGEITVRASVLQVLSKALAPPTPVNDSELRQRQRYLDLLNPEVRNRFQKRAIVVKELRRLLDISDFMEVETPMLVDVPSGASAEPFITRHNATGQDLHLRIAPELYLKRLLVGGFERVYELNKSFRNEGTSRRHNPEFTMLEIYCAYMDCFGMMNFVENLLRAVSHNLGNPLPSFRIMSMNEAVSEYGEDWESHLIEPTFITGFTTEESPLAKANCVDGYAERFELYINGMEIANGFTEQTDPEKQYRAFINQGIANGELPKIDIDYVRAMSYGMPPAAGVGIGIDRLVMILTGAESIRDVVLFPTLRQK